MRRPAEKSIRKNIAKLKKALKEEPRDFAKLERKIEQEERKLKKLLKPAKFLKMKGKQKHRLLSKTERYVKKVR